MVQIAQPIPPATSAAPSAIELRGLTLAYDRLVALSRASFEVPAGSLAAVVGPAGAGKSSLLKSVMGQLGARSGEIRVLGGDPRAVRERVAYVPRIDLVDWQFPISLGEIVGLGRPGRPSLLARPGAIGRSAALECLEALGLRALADQRIARLDSRQRRRALLARALAQAPRLVLVEEPAAEGDPPPLADDFFEALDRCRDGGRTVLVATRDLAEATRRYDWLALLNGRIVAHGRPAQVLTVENLREAYGDGTLPVRVAATTFAVDG